MKTWSKREWIGLVTVALGIVDAAWAADANAESDAFSQPYAQVLRSYVRQARVDYARLKSQSSGLDTFLNRVADLPATEFSKWPREKRLALLLNLYNAQTLRLILDHYPISSIRKIGLLPGAAWKKKVVRFAGRTLSLDDLEHDIIRKEYGDPRIHFALVCAAKGCPPLRSEPYDGARLHDQLDDQARSFLGDRSKNRVDADGNTLWLSPIFEWYGTDFTAGGQSLVSFVSRFLPADSRRTLETLRNPQVRYTDYDWTLNDVHLASESSP